MSVATTKEGQPLVDETEAATAGTVTTSTVKHDVAVKNPVHEDDDEVIIGNSNDAVADPALDEDMKRLFARYPLDQEAQQSTEVVLVDTVTEELGATESEEERKAQLERCELKITKGMATYVEVGMALAHILLNKLYLLEYKTWDEYLDLRWGFTKQRAFQYMNAADGHQRLSTQIAGKRKLPQSERGMRELLKVSPDKVIDVLDKLGDKGELTAERIIKVREEVLPKKTSTKAKKKAAIKIEAAMKAVGVWTAFLSACDLASLTDQQRKELQKAQKSAADKFNKLHAAA